MPSLYILAQLCRQSMECWICLKYRESLFSFFLPFTKWIKFCSQVHKWWDLASFQLLPRCLWIFTNPLTNSRLQFSVVAFFHLLGNGLEKLFRFTRFSFIFELYFALALLQLLQFKVDDLFLLEFLTNFWWLHVFNWNVKSGPMFRLENYFLRVKVCLAISKGVKRFRRNFLFKLVHVLWQVEMLLASIAIISIWLVLHLKIF